MCLNIETKIEIAKTAQTKEKIMGQMTIALKATHAFKKHLKELSSQKGDVSTNQDIADFILGPDRPFGCHTASVQTLFSKLLGEELVVTPKLGLQFPTHALVTNNGKHFYQVVGERDAGAGFNFRDGDGGMNGWSGGDINTIGFWRPATNKEIQAHFA